ncbi:hypothetical protein [Acinetobacter sp.]|uniref:hypothetical protein n=1 Tax=Acinetobacter sp. TaxID=472 RepID=UPI00375141B7
MLYASQHRYTDELNSPSEHHQLLHSTQHGHVIVWEKSSLNDGKGNWHKIGQEQSAGQVNTFLDGLKGNNDTYFTVNEFTGWRLQRLLKSLRANYVDLDIGAPATRYDLDIALEILHSKQMPSPSIAVFSGRGLHLYWIIKPTPAMALPVWQAVENALVKSLEDFHADMVVKDCTRVLRMVGTVNSKNGEMVRGLLLDPTPWSFHDLTNEVLGHISPSKPHKAKINSLAAAQIRKGIHPKASNHRRWHYVLKDLQKIGRYHRKIPEHFRNEYLFLSSVALSWFASPDTIETEVQDIAARFCPDVSLHEATQAASASITRAMAAAAGEKTKWCGIEKDPRYHFKRKTLFERIGPLALPILDQLQAIIPEELATARESNRQKHRDRTAEGRYRDKNTGKGHRQGNVEVVALARSLRAEGKSVREISSSLNKSVGSVHAWIVGVQISPL